MITLARVDWLSQVFHFCIYGKNGEKNHNKSRVYYLFSKSLPPWSIEISNLVFFNFLLQRNPTQA